MLTDAVLVDRVLAGFDDAFDELYRRHANAAWRLGQAVTGNSHDAADAVSEAFARVLQAVRAGRLQDGAAFKSYLLTATRNAALDGMRRQGKALPTDDEHLDIASETPSPADRLTGHEDAVLVAEAFRNLPERWRSVLWLTAVEGVATKDAAEQLGLTANGTAQLAVRARAGLRERYLQAHVRNHALPECRFTVEHLGAYVGGGIAPRDLAKVDQHLAACADCRARKEELDDLGPTLRRIALPIPLFLGAMSAEKVRTTLASANLAAGGGMSSGMARVVQMAKEPTPFMRRMAGASAAGVLALGLLSLSFVHGHDKVTGLATPRRTEAPASVELPPAVNSSSNTPTEQVTPIAAVAAAPPARSTFIAPPAPAPLRAAPPAATKPAPPPPPAATRPAPSSPLPALPATVCTVITVLCPGASTTPSVPILPTVIVGVNAGGHTAGVAVDLSTPMPTAGATVDTTTVASPAPTPAQPGTVVVQVTPVVPATTVHLP